jgi:small-conductance mechanosensitive channel
MQWLVKAGVQFFSPGVIDRLRSVLIGAALVLVALAIGWILGMLARVLFTALLGRRVEDVSRLLGYKQLERSLRLQSLRTLVGYAVQVVVTGLALLLLLGVYSPGSAQGLLVDSVSFLPTILIALTLLLLGLFLSQMLADVAFTAARAARRNDAAVISMGVRVVVVLLALAAALLELGVATVFISMMLAALLVAVALAAGLAAGLGGADYVRDVLAGRAVRAQLKPGQRIQIDEIAGIVVECGMNATLVVLDDGKRTLIPNKLITQKAIVLG